MFTKCDNCGRTYNDAEYLTFCPHNHISGACRKHDLFNCQPCRPEQLTPDTGLEKCDSIIGKRVEIRDPNTGHLLGYMIVRGFAKQGVWVDVSGYWTNDVNRDIHHVRVHENSFVEAPYAA